MRRVSRQPVTAVQRRPLARSSASRRPKLHASHLNGNPDPFGRESAQDSLPELVLHQELVGERLRECVLQGERHRETAHAQRGEGGDGDSHGENHRDLDRPAGTGAAAGSPSGVRPRCRQRARARWTRGSRAAGSPAAALQPSAHRRSRLSRSARSSNATSVATPNAIAGHERRIVGHAIVVGAHESAWTLLRLGRRLRLRHRRRLRPGLALLVRRVPQAAGAGARYRSPRSSTGSRWASARSSGAPCPTGSGAAS